MNFDELPGGEGYGPLVAATRRLVDAVAAAAGPDHVSRAATASLLAVCAQLEKHAVDEAEAASGQRLDLPSRGNPILVPFVRESATEDWVRGTATFSRAHQGRGPSAHGGTIPLLFEDVLGHLSARDGGRRPTRCAYLHVNYRAATPLDLPLTVFGRVDRVERRKVFVSGTLQNGETLLADAEALFVMDRREP